MPEVTPRLDLVKPEYDESANIQVINSNMDTLDGAVGVSIVNSVVEITTPFNGQQAYELNTRQLRFFINGEWLLIGAGDLNSGNPDRIRLPAGSLDNLSDTTNAFQIGADGSVNMAFDQNEIQARENGASSTLYLNEQGGAVNIGPNSELVINNKGIISTSMDSKEQFDGTNISVSATDWVSGSPDVTQDCEAPPSGKILVLLAGRGGVQTINGTGWISYKCTQGGPGGTEVVAPGGSGNSIQNKASSNNSSNNLTSTVPDIVKGLTPGQSYTFRVMHKKDAGGTVFNVDFRKIIVIPQV